MKRIFLAAVVLAAALALPGCLVIGGSSSSKPATLGQQLSDLKDARDKGAITEGEYEMAKRKLLGAGR